MPGHCCRRLVPWPCNEDAQLPHVLSRASPVEAWTPASDMGRGGCAPNVGIVDVQLCVSGIAEELYGGKDDEEIGCLQHTQHRIARMLMAGWCRASPR